MAAHVMSSEADASSRSIRRAREFYRYLHPDYILTNEEPTAFHLEAFPNLSHAFAPHSQLLALRCKAKKAMINFMDQNVMYFVSESSVQRTYVSGEEHCQFVEDPILTTCTSSPLEGRICEKVLHLEPRHDDKMPICVISDLTKSAFAHMPIISGHPYYRFYAGTPVRSKDGINIGSVAIMDDRVRDSLTEEQEDVLRNTASQIMAYLESHRQAVEGARARRMTAGLKAFLAGPKAARDTQNKSPTSDTVESNPQKPTRLFLGANRRHSTMSDGTTAVSSSATRSRSDTLHHAANLIREGLSLDKEGAVTFFRLGKASSGSLGGESPTSGHTNDARRKRRSHRIRPARIIARTAPPLCTKENTQHHTASLDEDFLGALAKEYPDGHLWSLESGPRDICTSDCTGFADQEDASYFMKPAELCKKDFEFQKLKAAFPSAHQLLYAPVHDSDSAQTAYCLFVESDDDVRSFSTATDLPFLLTFCSSITTEISKMDALMTDKQKSDFVGTISHEMRSPLHGILGSAEFLAETELTIFQQSLIKTIETCGKTLLDTMNHVLDYSKINSFERQWKASQGSKMGTHDQPQIGDMALFDENNVAEASPLSQIATATDMAEILEEVVDSLVFGQAYTQNADITSRGDSRKRNDSQNHASPLHPEVIIDVQSGDWVFLAQPGAVRRVFMNVVGNALKYTRSGSITISLELRPSVEQPQSDIVVFTVVDTGQGISAEFLNSKLFLPFAQENALTPGTGLGLSIVHSIVSMLGGSINIKSELGEGTIVQVELPLKRPKLTQSSSNNQNQSSLSHAPSATSSKDSFVTIRNTAPNTTVAFYPIPRNDKQRKILSSYVTDWCDLQISQTVETASIVIVNEEDLGEYVQNLRCTNSHPKIIVICGETTSERDLRDQDVLRSSSRGFECVAKPCGPRKLARALQIVLESSSTGESSAEESSKDQVNGWLRHASFESRNSNLANQLENLSIHELERSGVTEGAARDEPQRTNASNQPLQRALTPVSDMSLTTPILPRTQIDNENKDMPRSAPFQDSTPSPPKTPEPALPSQRKMLNPYKQPQNGSGHTARAPALDTAVAPRQPRVLLVDDNQVNLRLLETYLRKKRQYTKLTKAEDGQQAVEAFVSALSPTNSSSESSSSPMTSASNGISNNFDLIFMDISMPVMDGFAATRAIRQHEALLSPLVERDSQFPQAGNQGFNRRTGAFIVAMTGLASAKDQTEGYESGCDVYMTKPVSFKEVSKLLDEWEANQQAVYLSTKIT